MSTVSSKRAYKVKECAMNYINYKNADITGGYWGKKQKLNRDVTINAVYDRFLHTGRIDAFKCNWREGTENKPHYFWDSDVAKWIEGAAYILAKTPDKELESKVESIIDDIEKNMGADGYFNIYFTAIEPSKRFSNRDCHELYCAGHLIEAAVAYFDATGKDRFLKLMCRYADYIYDVFCVKHSAAFETPGHEEIELALYRLYKCTGNKKHLELMTHFLLVRGNNPKDTYTPFYNYSGYAQDYAPVFEQTHAIGHAVRAMYLYSAMADLAKETKNPVYVKACRTLFDEIYSSKMYITGALGSTRHGEAFTKPYDLPNSEAYAETCASIGLMFFAKRMSELENDAVFADVLERAMYNGMISGLSLDGKSFFYENPLEIDLEKRDSLYYRDANAPIYGITQRAEVFSCSCCPPNLNRLLSSLSGYIYALDKDTVFINQYMQSTAHQDGVTVSTVTDYPLNGGIKINIGGAKKAALRIPSWCKSFKLNRQYTLKDGYAYTDTDGEILLELDMTPSLVYANPKCRDLCSRAAVQRGPIVYCAEGVDNGKTNLNNLFLDADAAFSEEYSEKLGCTVLKTTGSRADGSANLYSLVKHEYRQTPITLIPFCTFANRGESDMLVWLHTK